MWESCGSHVGVMWSCTSCTWKLPKKAYIQVIQVLLLVQIRPVNLIDQLVMNRFDHPSVQSTHNFLHMGENGLASLEPPIVSFPYLYWIGNVLESIHSSITLCSYTINFLNRPNFGSVTHKWHTPYTKSKSSITWWTISPTLYYHGSVTYTWHTPSEYHCWATRPYPTVWIACIWTQYIPFLSPWYTLFWRPFACMYTQARRKQSSACPAARAWTMYRCGWSM